MSGCKIHNNTDMSVDNEINSLVDFAKQRLGFKNLPSIFLNHDERNSQKVLARTGHYDPNTIEIHVYVTGRHPKDILRSIAHELVHHYQNEKGDFNDAGYSGKGYAQKNPHLRNMELQANDPMLFRDWEDSLKEKYPTIYNERRSITMSLKDWKNKELSENLNKKWGFKMDLTKLNEGSCGANEAHCNEEEQLEEQHWSAEYYQSGGGHGTGRDSSDPRKMGSDKKKEEPKKDDQSSHAKAKKRTLEEDELEEGKGDCPECKNAKEDCVCPDKKKKMEENEEKPDFPDVDGDGNRDESITQAQKDKKAKEGDDGKKKDLSKVPPQLRKHVAKK